MARQEIAAGDPLLPSWPDTTFVAAPETPHGVAGATLWASLHYWGGVYWRGSNPQQIRAHFRVLMLRRPQAQGDGGELVDHGDGAAVLRHVDRLDVVMAGVARFDADVRVLLGDVDGELFDVLLAAGGAYDAPEVPLRGTERADQRALAAVSHGSQDAHLRPAGADGTEKGRFMDLPRLGVIGEMLGVGLQERPGDQLLGGIEGRRTAGRAGPPEVIQHLFPAHGSRVAQAQGRVREGSRRDLLNERKKRREPGEKNEQLELVAEPSRRALNLRRAVAGGEADVERFLKARDVLVEAQTLGGEREPSSELGRPLDSLVPLIADHSCSVTRGRSDRTRRDGTAGPICASRRRARSTRRRPARPPCPCRRE